MTIETPRQTLVGIQCLRGLAALMVVFYHVEVQTSRLGIPWPHLPVLQAGVDIFFVISGFIIWWTTANRPDRTIWQFYWDRVRRIVPLYWVMTGVVVIVLVVAPFAVRTAVLDPEHILKSFLFIPARHPLTQSFQPTLVPGWSLNMEMFFYLIFGIAIVIGGRSLTSRTAILVTTLVGLVVIGVTLKPAGILSFYTQDLIIEFAAGVLLAVAYGKRWLRPGGEWWIAVAVGALLLVYVQLFPVGLPRSIEWGGPSFLMVLGGVLVPRFSFQPLERLGDWSYTLYLLHPITLAAFSVAWRSLALPPSLLFAGSAISGTLVAAGAIYNFVERPIDRWLRSLSRGGPSTIWRAESKGRMTSRHVPETEMRDA